MLREFTLEVPLARFGICLSIADGVDFENAASENRIMQTAGVVHNRHHLAGQGRPEYATFAKKDVTRHLERVPSPYSIEPPSSNAYLRSSYDRWVHIGRACDLPSSVSNTPLVMVCLPPPSNVDALAKPDLPFADGIIDEFA